ncbi:MAG: DUF4382 domain-containing protein [Woeseiaceae bacterium]|nr:DUF4382 domain-containing protein [Woeseiaceae bacterium]
MDNARKGFWFAIAASTALGLGGCGGSGDGGAATGNLTIGLTDGPVEYAYSVVVEFTGIEIKPVGGPPEVYNECDGDPSTTNDVCTIDLLQYQGEERTIYFSDEVAAGDYEWIRLLVNAQPNTIDSYITFEEGGEMCSLFIPSGAQTGLKVQSPFTVTANGVTDYTLDFDVRKSITNPPGLAGEPSRAATCTDEYLMKPVIRIVDTTETGAISGVIDESLLQTEVMNAAEEMVPACEQDEATMEYINAAVYVFWEDGAAPPAADDIDIGANGADLGGLDPIATASVKYDSELPGYVYEVGYLLADETYRVALTCDADADMRDSDEFDPEDPDASADVFRFLSERDDVIVTVNEAADGDLPVVQ